MKIEIRENKILLDGYVNVCSRDSRVLPSSQGKFIEQILPKTFERALGNAKNVDLLFNHDKGRKLGSIQDGNLELYEDNIGLRAKCEVSDEEVITRAKEGKLSGWSFGFISLKDKWEDAKDGVKRRFVEELELLEVSILDKTPAYLATSIEVRGGDTLVVEQRNEDFESIIKDKEEVEPVVDGEELLEEEPVVEEKVVTDTLDEVVVDEPKVDEEAIVDEPVVVDEEADSINIQIAIYEKELELLKLKARQ